ncbi:MAG: hypothetical protein LBD78_02205 [Spirochaetaceae bacterium]|jgi:hypothetical protein|nr:hypothetical protein [Spirochaetaceae bacterium]
MCVNDIPGGGKQSPGITVLEAAAQMLLEQGAQFNIIDWEEVLEKYRLLIFPNIVYFDEEREKKIRACLDRGGRVYKQLVAGAVSLLLGRRLVESDLPSTARTSVCDMVKEIRGRQMLVLER